MMTRAHVCLMAHHKEKYLEVSDSNSHFKPSYDQMSKAFREMHTNALNDIKKTSLQKEMIS